MKRVNTCLAAFKVHQAWRVVIKVDVWCIPLKLMALFALFSSMVMVPWLTLICHVYFMYMFHHISNTFHTYFIIFNVSTLQSVWPQAP